MPRPLSLLFAFMVLFSGTNVGALTLGAAIVGVATVVFAGNIDARSHAHDPPRGSGTITAIEERTYKGRVNGHVVTARMADGTVVVSHFPGSFYAPSVGNTVAIAGDDAHLVIVGGLLREHGPSSRSMMPAVNALLGGLLLVVVLSRLRLLHVLRYGRPARARIVDRVRKKSTTQLIFAFTDDAGRARRHKAEADRYLEDDAEEPLLYTRFFAALLDGLPGRPRLENGRFVRANDGSLAWAVAGLLALIAYPLLVVVALRLPLL